MRLLALQQELINGGMTPIRSINHRVSHSFSTPLSHNVGWLSGAELQQPKSMDCWITCITMLYSWRNRQSFSVDTIARQIGEPFLGFFNNNTGLYPRDEQALLQTTGLVGHYGTNYPIEEYGRMLDNYGPLMISIANTTANTPNWGMHARVLIAIQGDGSQTGTTMYFVDPWTGTQTSEPFDVFLQKYEREISQDGTTRNHIIHWPGGARQLDTTNQSHSFAYASSIQFSVAQGLLTQTDARSLLLSYFKGKIFGKSMAALQEVHLDGRSPVTRANGNKAQKLNESGQPIRTDITSASQLTTIVEWLSVDNPQHLRYQPASGNTYCNIYAYDYCTLARAYFPRVFWTNAAITNIQNDQAVTAQYGTTIHELSANALTDWFSTHGADFGWVVPSSLTSMQDWVNRGAVGVIVGYKSPHGHVTVVVPETDTQKAERNGNDVTAPLQSQAGARNLKYHKNNWWNNHNPHGFYLWLGMSVETDLL